MNKRKPERIKMQEIEKAGAFSPGQKVKPVRDISIKIKSSLFDDTTHLARGESYLIEKCYDLVWREDMKSDDPSLERIRMNHALMYSDPRNLQYRLKLYGFELMDRFGFDYYLPANLFVPEWYNI